MFKSPKATVGAILFHPDKGIESVLLTKRNIEPFYDYWCFPGGHVEEFESLENAIIREVKEETGYDIKPEYLHFCEEIFTEKSIHNVAIFYTGKATGKMIMDENEVKEMKWFSIKEAKQIKLAFNHIKVLEFYIKKFKIKNV
ncbi:NUDIX hydrolase [Bacteroidota bacterium]